MLEWTWDERFKSFQQGAVGKVVMKIWDRGERSMKGVITEKYGVLEGGWRAKNITLPCGRGL